MISPVWDTVALAVLGFLMGSVPIGLLIARAQGINIREVGSGNIGATNSMRALGAGWGVLVGILDALKGAVPAYLALQMWPLTSFFSPWPGIVGGAAVLGHIFSPWLGFKGGKGVATSLAVFLVLAPLPTLTVIGIWIILFLSTGYVSLASILSLVSLPVSMLIWNGMNPEISILAAAVGCALISTWAHRTNIARLVKGEEKRGSLWRKLWKK